MRTQLRRIATAKLGNDDSDVVGNAGPVSLPSGGRLLDQNFASHFSRVAAPNNTGDVMIGQKLKHTVACHHQEAVLVVELVCAHLGLGHHADTVGDGVSDHP